MFDIKTSIIFLDIGDQTKPLEISNTDQQGTFWKELII